MLEVLEYANLPWFAGSFLSDVWNSIHFFHFMIKKIPAIYLLEFLAGT